MASAANDDRTTHASTGSYLSEATYLDDHFLAMQDDYEAMLRAVPLRPQMRVLDAGCGGGSYLSLLSDLVGPSGSIVAIDNAPENIQRVNALIHQRRFRAPLEAFQADVTDLPFPDGHFDAVWSANVTQYLSDSQFHAALKTFRRVVKPGGLVALKEFDLSGWVFGPFPTQAIWRLLANGEIASACLRALEFPRYMRDIGLEQITTQTIVTECRPPLSAAALRYFRSCFPFWQQAASQLPLPMADMDAWNMVGNIDSPTHILQSPDFYWRDSHVVTIGRVPQ